jgi:uncharacterized membrane protein
MNFDTSKNLGGVGALLLFIGVLIPTVASFLGNIMSLVGLILLLAALYGFAGYYKERSIFNNAIFAIVIAVVGVVVTVIVAIALLYAPFVNLLQLIYPGWSGPPNWQALSSMTPNTANLTPENLLPIITSGIVGLAVAWVLVWFFSFVTTFMVRKSLRALSVKSGTGLLSTAGLLLLIGGLLTVIFVGFILMWIALLVLAVGFFGMKRAEPVVEAAVVPPAPAPA